jgi:hypothetical protein
VGSSWPLPARRHLHGEEELNQSFCR